MELKSVAETRLPTTFRQEGAVPRIIHQTFRHKLLHDDFRGNIAQLLALNPGWDYVFYDDTDVERFIAQDYGPQILAYYHRIDEHYGNARADLFRYLLLYRRGGVYLDIKSSATKPLAEVIHKDDFYILSQWPNQMGEPFFGWGIHPDLACIEGGEFQQWNIISTPGHPFLRAVIECVLANIDRYDPVVHGTGLNAALRVCGPIAYTLAIHPLMPLHPHRKVRRHTDLGLKYSIFEADSRTKHRQILGTSWSYEGRPLIRTPSRGSILPLSR